jgi:hypothetical protein
MVRMLAGKQSQSFAILIIQTTYDTAETQAHISIII